MFILQNRHVWMFWCQLWRQWKYSDRTLRRRENGSNPAWDAINAGEFLYTVEGSFIASWGRCKCNTSLDLPIRFNLQNYLNMLVSDSYKPVELKDHPHMIPNEEVFLCKLHRKSLFCFFSTNCHHLKMLNLRTGRNSMGCARFNRQILTLQTFITKCTYNVRKSMQDKCEWQWTAF
jgi:hypothetical protein